MKPHLFMLAAASGALSALSVVFPTLFFFIWIAFVPLFLSLRARPMGERFWIGLLTGVVYFSGAFYWLWSSTTHFFAFSALTASLLLLCFLIWHGFFFALFAAALPQQSSVGYRLLFPAFLWTALEHYYPMLIPWQFGAILQPHLEVIQLAEVTGGAGLSCAILLVNGLLFHAYEQRRGQKSVPRIKRRRARNDERISGSVHHNAAGARKTAGERFSDEITAHHLVHAA